eukprot:PhM_4_TR10394/c0_g1_i1/m.87364/K18272/RP2; protein XRP2
MGNSCFSSKTAESDGTSKKNKHHHKAVKQHGYSWQREKVAGGQPKEAKEIVRDPAHYQAHELDGATVVRGPGTLNDQQFSVDKCKNCTFLLLDILDSVVADECEKCIFVIGPTSGSVFLRTCVDCIVIVACAQLRLRDCVNTSLLLYCQSRPAIESSKGIRIGCHQHYYFEMQEQMDEARLSVYNNRFDEVHDFTAKAGGVQAWSLLGADVTPRSLGVPALSTLIEDMADGEEQVASDGRVPFVIPRLDHSAKLDGVYFLFFPPGCATVAAAALSFLSGPFVVTRTRETPLYVDAHVKTLRHETMLGPDKVTHAMVKSGLLLSGPCIGMLVTCAADVTLEGVWAELATEESAGHVIVVGGHGDSAAAVQRVSEFFFTQVQNPSDGFGKSH